MNWDKIAEKMQALADEANDDVPITGPMQQTRLARWQALEAVAEFARIVAEEHAKENPNA